MSWSTIESHWADYKDAVQEEWDNLSDEAFGKIAGDRAQLVNRIQESYGVSAAEAELQVTAFEAAYPTYPPARYHRK